MIKVKTFCFSLIVIIFCFNPALADTPVENKLIIKKFATQNDDGPVHQVMLFTNSFSMDRIYTSMYGPYESTKFHPLGNKEAQLIWLTAAHIEVLDPNGMKSASPQYLCHQQTFLDFSMYGANRFKAFGNVIRKNVALFNLGQGIFSLKFPKNFGIPLNASEPLLTDSMAMNPAETKEEINIRFRTIFDFKREEDLTEPIKPLYMLQVAVLVPVGEQHESHNEGVIFEALSTSLSENKQGNYLTGHWYVPPGRHTYRHNLKEEMAKGLPFDTTVHYIAVHMHPFAESLELKDLTSGKSIFKSNAQNYDNIPALKSLETFASEEGTPIYRDHEYELITVYNNTTKKKIDVMAAMYLYLLDKSFDKTKIGLKKEN